MRPRRRREKSSWFGSEIGKEGRRARERRLVGWETGCPKSTECVSSSNNILTIQRWSINQVLGCVIPHFGCIKPWWRAHATRDTPFCFSLSISKVNGESPITDDVPLADLCCSCLNNFNLELGGKGKYKELTTNEKRMPTNQRERAFWIEYLVRVKEHWPWMLDQGRKTE